MALLKINTTNLPAPTVLQPGIQDLDSEDGTGTLSLACGTPY